MLLETFVSACQPCTKLNERLASRKAEGNSLLCALLSVAISGVLMFLGCGMTQSREAILRKACQSSSLTTVGMAIPSIL